MASKTIKLAVDADVARVYEEASPETQRKIQTLFGLLLRDLAEILSREMISADVVSEFDLRQLVRNRVSPSGSRLTVDPQMPKPRVEKSRILKFDNDEDGYLNWIANNESGFVINTPKSGGYGKLHKATCGLISTDRWTNYTTTTYMKYCSLDKQELIDWGKSHSNDFSMCEICNR